MRPGAELWITSTHVKYVQVLYYIVSGIIICHYNKLKRGLLRWRSNEKGWVLWFQRVKDRFDKPVFHTLESENPTFLITNLRTILKLLWWRHNHVTYTYIECEFHYWSMDGYTTLHSTQCWIQYMLLCLIGQTMQKYRITVCQWWDTLDIAIRIQSRPNK